MRRLKLVEKNQDYSRVGNHEEIEVLLFQSNILGHSGNKGLLQ
jgi:hypothetical protein